MTPAAEMLFVLLVLACPVNEKPGSRDCVAVVAETPSVAACRALFLELKATLPAGLVLTYPECTRRARVGGA